MSELQIRTATIKDVGILNEIGRQTFEETFRDTNTSENLTRYLDESFNQEQLMRELSHPSSFFYLATREDLVVGYLKLNVGDAQTEFSQQGGLEIERIYVIKEYWGKSVGQALLDYALGIAAGQKNSFVWLGVWEKNYRALRFYRKNGFVPFDQHIFQVGDDPQTDLLMKKML
ncbi:MAG: GNAT family N-acetyltransferase [Bacteroidales bacterium]